MRECIVRRILPECNRRVPKIAQYHLMLLQRIISLAGLWKNRGETVSGMEDADGATGLDLEHLHERKAPHLRKSMQSTDLSLFNNPFFPSFFPRYNFLADCQNDGNEIQTSRVMGVCMRAHMVCNLWSILLYCRRNKRWNFENGSGSGIIAINHAQAYLSPLT